MKINKADKKKNHDRFERIAVTVDLLLFFPRIIGQFVRWVFNLF